MARAALARQGKLAESEPLLKTAYEGLHEMEDEIPDRFRDRVAKAASELAFLYGSWRKLDDAAKWQRILAERHREAVR